MTLCQCGGQGKPTHIRNLQVAALKVHRIHPKADNIILSELFYNLKVYVQCVSYDINERNRFDTKIYFLVFKSNAESNIVVIVTLEYIMMLGGKLE